MVFTWSEEDESDNQTNLEVFVEDTSPKTKDTCVARRRTTTLFLQVFCIFDFQTLKSTKYN